MKYLTRIIVPKLSLRNLDIFDSYRWHKKLCKAFKAKGNNHFLFRVDDYRKEIQTLVLSESKPELQSWGQWTLKEISPVFLQHEIYSFQLKANPTKRRRDDNSKSRKRFGIYDEEELKQWLMRKATEFGFEINRDSIDVGKPMDNYFLRRGDKGKHISVDFKGELIVTNREKFINCFNSGIGSAKSFGYGMLTLIPVQKSNNL